jgi:hypothetical protein
MTVGTLLPKPQPIITNKISLSILGFETQQTIKTGTYAYIDIKAFTTQGK